MKRAKQRTPARVPASTPRNPLATDPLLKKGGAHQPRGKNAKRARQKARLRSEMDQDDGI